MTEMTDMKTNTATEGTPMTMLSFPEAEFEQRLQRIQAELVELGLDAVVLTRPENIYYACGYRAAHVAQRTAALHALTIPAAGEPRLIARSLEAATVLTQWSRDPRLFNDDEDPFLLIETILRESGVIAGAIGIEERFFTVRQARRLSEIAPRAKLTDVTGLIEKLTAKPSPAELDRIRASARITEAGFTTGLQAMVEGVYPYEVIGQVHDAMYAAGQPDFDLSGVYLWSGPGGGRMHDTTTTEIFKPNDLATLEIFGVDSHYKSCSQGTVHIGDALPHTDVSAAQALVMQMHDEALARVVAGATAGDVFEAANSVYRSAKGRDYYRRVGGSVGLTLFALDLVKGSDAILTPGVPLLIQTLVDDPALVTCSSTVIVTESGAEQLTSPIRSLTPQW